MTETSLSTNLPFVTSQKSEHLNDSIPTIKRPEPQAAHPPLSIDEVMNVWLRTSAPSFMSSRHGQGITLYVVKILYRA